MATHSKNHGPDHGIYSKEVVLSSESLPKFQRFRDDYLDIYEPKNRAELDTVEEIILCRWRLIRHWTAETASLDLELQELKPKIQQAAEFTTPACDLGITYRASEKSIANFRRIEASLSRQASQAEQRLTRLRATFQRRAAQQPSHDRKGVVSAKSHQ